MNNTNEQNRYKNLVLLHSNDMHGDFLAEHVDEKLTGGVSMLSGYLNKVREENPNTIYAIAGDMFRGSVIDSEFQGLSTVELMNMLSPDVVTIGNHEVDYGVAHLLFIEKCAKFPIINANLHIKMNNKRLFKPCEIIEIDGMKILFIGILTEAVLSQTKSDGLVGTFISIEEAAQEVGKICNSYNSDDIDFTVLLTHIGFEEDKKLAAALDPAWGVDVIIGGHSHTFLTEPAVVNNIPIVQAGTGTDQIGRFDIVIDTEKNCIESYEWKPVPIDETHCPHDPQMDELLMEFKGKTDMKYGRVVTRFAETMYHPIRTKQTPLGSLFAEILRESLGVDIFLLGSGSIRNTELGPIVTYQDLMECYPYDGAVYEIKVTGEQLRRMLLYVYRDAAWNGEHTEFYQLSGGLYCRYCKSGRCFHEFMYNGRPIKDDDVFTVALQKFHFLNFDYSFGFDIAEVEKNQKPRIISTSDQQILDEYLSALSKFERFEDIRLEVIE